MKKVVYGFVVGDLLHEGHIRYIEQAKKLGDYLIIGVLTDEAVQTYKRKTIQSLEERFRIISSIRGIDEIVTQNSRDPSDNILKFRPDIVTHGDDWKEDTFPGKRAMKKVGAKLVLTKYFKPQSTTKIIRRICNRHANK